MAHWLIGAAAAKMPEAFLDSLPEDHPARIMLRALEAIATGAVNAGSTKDNLYLARSIASDALHLVGHPAFGSREFTVGDTVRLLVSPRIVGEVRGQSDIPGLLDCLDVKGEDGKTYYYQPEMWERIG